MAVPAWFVWAGRCCRAHSPLFVGKALQNKLTTVPETKLPPLTLHFPVQNGMKTCWRTAEQPKSFAIPPLTQALRAHSEPQAQTTKAEEEEVTVGPS